MKRKEYKTPTIEVVKLKQELCLQTASGTPQPVQSIQDNADLGGAPKSDEDYSGDIR
jgi:hypothetical protein